MRWCVALALLLLMAGCGVFRDVKRERHRLDMEAKLATEFVRVDTGKRLVLETWRSFPALQKLAQGGDISAPALRSIQSDMDSLGIILEGTRLTLEQGGRYESGSSTAEVVVDERTSERTAESSWKGMWMWVIGIALVLVFLYILIRTYIPKMKQ